MLAAHLRPQRCRNARGARALACWPPQARAPKPGRAPCAPHSTHSPGHPPAHPPWQGPDRELEVPEGAAAVAAASGTGLVVTCRYGDWAQPDVTLATAAQLDAQVAPNAVQPQVAPAPASGPPASEAGPAAGDVVAPSAAAKPAVSAASLARAARILEPGSGSGAGGFAGAPQLASITA